MMKPANLPCIRRPFTLQHTPRALPRLLSDYYWTVSSKAFLLKKNPPTELLEIATGVHILRQPFSVFTEAVALGLNTIVARLEDESLWVHSPNCPTAECLDALHSLSGTVRHIVLPNNSPEHWVYGPKLAQHFPQATVYACPGILQDGSSDGTPYQEAFSQELRELNELRQAGRLRILGERTPEEWLDEVDAACFQSPLPRLYTEVNFLLKNYRMVTSCDAFFAYQPQQDHNEAFKAGMRLMGAENQLAGFFAAPAIVQQAAGGREYLAKIASWDFDSILTAHAGPVVANGKAEFLRTFKEVLQMQ